MTPEAQRELGMHIPGSETVPGKAGVGSDIPEQHPEDFLGAPVLCSGCKGSALQLAASHGSDPGSSAAASLQLHQLLENQLPFS